MGMDGYCVACMYWRMCRHGILLVYNLDDIYSEKLRMDSISIAWWKISIYLDDGIYDIFTNDDFWEKIPKNFNISPTNELED